MTCRIWNIVQHIPRRNSIYTYMVNSILQVIYFDMVRVRAGSVAEIGLFSAFTYQQEYKLAYNTPINL